MKYLIFVFFTVVLFTMFFSNNAYAGSECTCLNAGKSAWRNGKGTSVQRIKYDKCTSIDEKAAWNAGISDERYNWNTGRDKYCSSSSQSNSQPSRRYGGHGNRQSSGIYRADWQVWLHEGQTISGCPNGFPTLYRGFCYANCPTGYYGYHLTRGDVCVSCSVGAQKVELRGDGQVYCFK